MGKVWKKPALEVLDIKRTAGGPGTIIPDGVQNDPDEDVNHDS